MACIMALNRLDNEAFWQTFCHFATATKTQQLKWCPKTYIKVGVLTRQAPPPYGIELADLSKPVPRNGTQASNIINGG
jgi:hypothetical protein